MKKIILALLLILSVPTFVAAASDPVSVLRQYYEADKAEEIETMIDLTDFSSVNSSELAQFKDDLKINLQALAFVFDTKYYEISNEKVLGSGNDVYIFYHLKNQVQDTKGKILNEDRDYVAVMHKTGANWKIVYMQPKAIFEQSNMMRSLTASAGVSVPQIIDFATSKGKTMVGGILLWIFRILFVVVAIAGIAAIVLFCNKNREMKIGKKLMIIFGLIFATLVVLYLILYFSGAMPD